MGSLEPDSTSSRESVWFLRASFLDRRMLNTEAASVEEMTEPMSRLSSQGSLRTKWAKRPTAPAVPATPMVDSTTAGAATGLAAFRLVPKPP